MDERCVYHHVVIDKASKEEMDLIKRALSEYKNTLAEDIAEYAKSTRVDDRIGTASKAIMSIQNMLNSMKVINSDKYKLEESSFFSYTY